MILNRLRTPISAAHPKLFCEKSPLIHRGLLQQIYRLFYVALALGCMMTAPVKAAPEEIPAWPKEPELILAMQKSVKGGGKPAEVISIRSTHSVRIGKDEDAFVVSVWWPNRGRNFSAGTFLYRPKLKEAKELEYTQSLGTRYVTGYYNDFVVLEQYSSGQGAEQFSHAIVRFVDWNVQVLHEAHFGNNLGTCGSSSAGSKVCEQTGVQFQFFSSAEPKLVELIEISTRMVGSDRSRGQSSMKSRRMRLIGDRFVVVKT